MSQILRPEYVALQEAVADALRHADPVGLIAMGAPDDEYSPEVATIAPRLADAVSMDGVCSILHEEHVRWFDIHAGERERYMGAAEAIWPAVQVYRTARASR